MLLCDGENSLASKNKDEILTDLIKKKEAWVATAEMERNEDNLNLLLAKIDVARKIIEHYSKP
jgi:ribonuclease HII